MSNSAVKISVHTLAERCAVSSLFRAGYESYVKGKPFDYALADQSQYYERGRMFAIYTITQKAPRATWRQNILAKTARERIVRSCALGYLR